MFVQLGLAQSLQRTSFPGLLPIETLLLKVCGMDFMLLQPGNHQVSISFQ